MSYEITQSQQEIARIDMMNEPEYIQCEYCSDHEEPHLTVKFLKKICCEWCLKRITGLTIKVFKKQKRKAIKNRNH